MYNFDDMKPSGKVCIPKRPQNMFIGSYAPIAKPGTDSGFFVNTYFLQPDRKSELGGGVAIRSGSRCN